MARVPDEMPRPGVGDVRSQMMGLEGALAGIEAHHTAAVRVNLWRNGKMLGPRQHDGMRTTRVLADHGRPLD